MPRPADPGAANRRWRGGGRGPAERTILYYKHPMGEADFSAEPKKDAMGMDYIPVYADEEEGLEPASPAGAHDHGARRARRRFGRAQDPLLPQPDGPARYLAGAEEGSDGDGLHSRLRGRRSGRRHRQGQPGPGPDAGRAHRTGRAAAPWSGRCAPSAPSSSASASRPWSRPSSRAGSRSFTSIPPARRSAKGEPLMLVYSPLLVQTEQEYIDAAKMAASMARSSDEESRVSAKRLVEGALQRLRYLDFPEAEIKRLQRERRANRTIAWPAPFSGIVEEKMAFEGMRFMPGEPLYKIAGISPIWVMAEVFEQDLAHVAVGQPATVTVKAYPGRSFAGPRRLHLSDRRPGNAHRHASASSCPTRTASSRRTCTPRSSSSPCRRAGGADGAQFGGHRQRRSPGGADRPRRRPVRAPTGQAGHPGPTATPRSTTA